jgi:hypothetical protein
MGHEERFPPTRLSASCGFRKETIAGMRRNGRDAPFADLRRSTTCRSDSTLSCRSALPRPVPITATLIRSPRRRGKIDRDTARSQTVNASAGHRSAFPEDAAAAVWAEMKADLGPAVAFTRVYFVLAFDPHLALQPAAAVMNNRAGAALASSHRTRRWSKPDSNSTSHPLTRSPQLGWSWCVWQRATGPTPQPPRDPTAPPPYEDPPRPNAEQKSGEERAKLGILRPS